LVRQFRAGLQKTGTILHRERCTSSIHNTVSKPYNKPGGDSAQPEAE